MRSACAALARRLADCVTSHRTEFQTLFNVRNICIIKLKKPHKAAGKYKYNNVNN